MNWLKNIINKLFKKNDVKTLSESMKTYSDKSNSIDNFKIQLKFISNPDKDDKNGYGIQQKSSLKDMI